jgi:VanZ family protein
MQRPDQGAEPMNNSRLWIPILLSAVTIFLISQFGHVPQILDWIPAIAKEILGHLALFLFLGLFVARYLSEMGFRTTMVILLTVLLCAGFGIFDEFHQYFVVGRGVEFSDFVVDLVGCFTGGIIYILWTGLRQGQGHTIRNEVQTAVLLKQGGVALTLFVFILLPAAIYSCSIMGFAHSVVARPSVPHKVEAKDQHLDRPVHQFGKQPADNPPFVARPQNPKNSGENRHSKSETSLIEFIQVANFLSRKSDETVVAMEKQNRAGSEFTESWRSSKLAVKETRSVP